MRNGAPILVGGGRYIQGKDEINNLGREVLYQGKRVILVVDDIPWQKLEKKVSDNLVENGIEYTVHLFSGYCSDSNTSAIARKAKEFGAEVLVGLGGGRCMDTSKWSAELTGIPVITVPTSSATCASYVFQCVMYDDFGTSLYSNFTTKEVAAVLVDTQIIADAPARLYSSGVGDALAKLPEMTFSINHASSDWEQSVLPKIGLAISKFTDEIFFEKALGALEDIRQHKVTSDLEDVVNTAIQLTGLISCFASGGKQLAIAHSIYDCVTKYFKPQRANFLHGEIVSSGLAVQYGVNGMREEEIERRSKFLKDLGVPTNLRGIGIEPTEDNKKIILDYVFKHMEFDAKMKEMVQKNFERIW
ncbi:iron-containing alcohol dehydrogenase family protein [uncultured Sphaerochaeta sp.]|uniref:iron-containing alcohol dehydrogenase family protein n=1 Tax=uncultured Sphaerochaeta sp. TaxID=886478 RepID=UPI002A0A1571|nr:iron-containing alcohol dehydrogenase family protein [uncultured Sphaerochaeta sp.]